MFDLRVGTGFDAHALVPERALVLGGVTVPYPLGLLGHSDADVLVHAIMDSLLGAAGLPDIGNLFPDNDPAYAGADSLKLLAKVWARLQADHWSLSNLDSVVIAEKPKLKNHIPQMRENIAAVLGASVSQVNVKATTTEKLGFTGRGEGIAAQAVALLVREKP